MKNNKFDIKNFISPDVSSAPVYIWVWNDVCTREIIDVQLAEMQRLGIRAFYILPEPKDFRPDSMPTNLEPEYLSDEYFELCAYAVEQGEKLGMLCWMYDEGGWPSGSACGKVTKDHPEFAMQTLSFYERNFSAGEVYKKTKADVLAAFINDSDMISGGYVFNEDTVVSEYTAKKGNGSYPDLLNKKATEYFIEITHKKYASALKNSLGKTVMAMFTDEPKAPKDAFNDELVKMYEAKYGESVLPHLPLIADRVKATEENVHILRRWYDICSHAFCETFLLPCKIWANENGIAFTGHMDKDHDPLGCIYGGYNFNLMRALRCLDIPGIDVIRRQLYPENKAVRKDDMNSYNGFFPRYASSAAAQNGTKLAMSESFGVAGAAVTYDMMRYTIGYQAVRGINIFNLFNFSLGRKDAYLAQELPVYTENQPYYKHLDLFNRYMERLSYISSLGERVCETALYYPVSDIQGRLKAESVAKDFDALGRALEEKTVDFDIVDDDVIKSAENKDGCLSIGNAAYRHIILPSEAFIPEGTLDALNEFVRNGGKLSHSIDEAEPVIQVDNSGLRAMHRKAENAEIYCLFRESGESGEYKVSLPDEKGYLLDPESGRLQRFGTDDGVLELALAVGETAVIMLSDEDFDAEEKKELEEKFEIKNEFMFSKDTELICNENGFANVKHEEKTSPVTLGDWSSLIGSEYSGSCAYETSFVLPEEKIGKEGEIDLGEVHFAASVYINERFIGTALTSPYRLRIPEGVTDKNNTLRVIVTNTSANWYVHTDYFDKWDIKALSPYFEPELKYAEDFVSGGLYGPVAIYTEG